MTEPLAGFPPLDDRSLRLTPRETEVLERATLGETNAQVARALGITVHGVKFHLSSIFRKLGVQNRTEAASVYLQRMAGRR
jgi:DNA-binding CsgD family transcriptional regulator